MGHIRRRFIFIILLGGILVSCSPSDRAPSFDPDRLLTFSEDGLPGSEPEPFGRGWFRGGFHSSPVFSPDGDHMWWAGSWSTGKVYVSHFIDDVWTEQEEVSFSDNIRFYRDPFISPDGLMFYYISTDPLPGGEATGKENFWMVEWESGAWGHPRPLPEGINSLDLHWTPSVAANYEFYFAATIDGNPDLYKAEYKDGEYLDPVPLGMPVSSPELEFTPHIAPDGSYLLFSRAADRDSSPRLFISYAINGDWSDPVLVENVSSCISPIITPDGGYVIYLEGPSALAWRNTAFIEELKPE